MRNIVTKGRLFPLLVAVVVSLIAGYSWGASASFTKSAAGPELKAMELGHNYQRELGELQFLNNKLVFTSSKDKADSLSLDYSNLKKVEFKSARLLRVETEKGEKKEFSPIGATTFDSKMVAYLKDHLDPSVELKSHIG